MNSNFEIPLNLIVGEKTDAASHLAKNLMRISKTNPLVKYNIISNGDGVFSGAKIIRSLVNKVLPAHFESLEVVDDGSEIKKNDIVFTLVAQFMTLSLYVSSIFSILTNCSNWSTATAKCLKASNNKKLTVQSVFYSLPQCTEYVEYAAEVAGAHYRTSPDTNKLCTLPAYSFLYPFHIGLLGGTINAFKLQVENHKNDELNVALLPDQTSCVEDAKELLKLYPTGIDVFHLSNYKKNFGINTKPILKIRELLKDDTPNNTKISISGELSPDSIAQLSANDGGPDIYCVGKYISFYNSLDFMIDLSIV